jgi:hypothetical protein
MRVSRWSMNMPVFCPASGSISRRMPSSTPPTVGRDCPRATRDAATNPSSSA